MGNIFDEHFRDFIKVLLMPNVLSVNQLLHYNLFPKIKILTFAPSKKGAA